jgi:small subunit ribosomal protein S17
MAEDTENTETTEETTPPVEAAPEAAAPEAAAEETAPEAAAEEAAPEAPAEEAPAPAAEAPAAPAAPAEPEVQLTPKERRQARRSAAVAKRGPRRAGNPEERDALRKKKASQRRAYRAKLKTRREEERKNAPAAEVVEDSHAHEKTGHQKVRQGVVVSDKADKTITVRIDVARRHKRYKKTIRSSSTLHAHDEANDAHTGDTVRVVEARPLSRTKRWRLVEVLERAK